MDENATVLVYRLVSQIAMRRPKPTDVTDRLGLPDQDTGMVSHNHPGGPFSPDDPAACPRT